MYDPTPHRSIRPYFVAGFGGYDVNVSLNEDGSARTESGTRPAWNVGGGLRYRDASLEVRYVSVGALTGVPATTFVPVTLGLSVPLSK